MIPKCHTEGFVEVVLEDAYGKMPSNQDNVAGIIIRADSTKGFPGGTWLQSTQWYPLLRGRIVAPEININLIKRWVKSCDSEHKQCRGLSPGDSQHQIRLIDVEREIVVSASLAEDYVALSYVWGRNTAPLLTRGTLPQYTSLRGFKGLTIPTTISDTMEVVRAIGKQYLWVDSLCIVQDDDSDKQQQLPIMDHVYSHASLVIISAAGCDANSGIPGVGTTKRNMRQHTENINGMGFVTAQPAVSQALEWTPWMTRGWTFQEAMLAQRVLIFTDNVVYWNCRESTWREDMTCESLGNGVELELTKTTSIWGYLQGGYEKEVCRTAFYCRQVSEFSRRSLADGRDALWAFLGILKFQAPRFRKGFIWGHPYERLDATLLWSEDVKCAALHPREVHQAIAHGNRSYDAPYPSWSWLSTRARVSFWHPCGDSLVSKVTWHTPYTFGTDDKAATTYLNLMTTPKSSTADAGSQEPSVSWSSGVKIMDFGLLHFTASAAQLLIKTSYYSSSSAGDTEKEDGWKSRTWNIATVYGPNGDLIAMLEVPVSFFRGQPERLGEFVVLSSNTEVVSDERCRILSGGLDCGTIKHIDGCRHIESHNIMLIEWTEGIAYRRALGRVSVELWQNVETKEKSIVLG